jgi:hypothetical protein
MPSQTNQSVTAKAILITKVSVYGAPNRSALLLLFTLLTICISPVKMLGQSQEQANVVWQQTPKDELSLSSWKDDFVKRPLEQSSFVLGREYDNNASFLFTYKSLDAFQTARDKLAKNQSILENALAQLDKHIADIRKLISGKKDAETDWDKLAAIIADAFPNPTFFYYYADPFTSQLNISYQPSDESTQRRYYQLHNYYGMQTGAHPTQNNKTLNELNDLTSDANITSYKTLLTGYKDAMSSQVKEMDFKLGAIKEMLPLLEKRQRDISEKLRSLDSGSTAVNTLIPVLPTLVGTLCALGVVLILTIKFFPKEVQIEWVASGQVIQFVTVLSLLIVILCLGIVRYLTENTLGTLLGGVSGYVLAQGVGRSATNAAKRAGDKPPDQLT